MTKNKATTNTRAAYGGVSLYDLGTIMQDLHDSEINAKVEWLFDGDWTVTLGDKMNGWERAVSVEGGDEAAAMLVSLAVSRYPDSAFAEKYAP